MICPKCGHSENEEREECGACGVVFARWRAVEERRRTPDGKGTVDKRWFQSGTALAIRTTAERLYDRRASILTPQRITALAVLLIVVIGVGGLVRNRAARATKKATHAAVIAGMSKDVGHEALEAQRRAAKPVKGRLDLSTEAALQMIGRCEAFTLDTSINLPGSFYENHYGQMIARYPALVIAEREGLVEFDPALPAEHRSDPLPPHWAPRLIRVQMTVSGNFDMRYARGSDLIEVNLGGRRVLRLTDLRGDARRAEADYDWEFMEPVAEKFGPRRGRGSATFVKAGASWRIKDVSIHPDPMPRICGKQEPVYDWTHPPFVYTNDER
jgi:hypothetical protein